MNAINLVFPHQLFRESPIIENELPIYLVEEFLFFKQYPFHKQKIAFHRASMQSYLHYLQSKNKGVHYIEAHEKQSDIRVLIPALQEQGIQSIHYIDPTDNWLSNRLKIAASQVDISLQSYDNLLFLNTPSDLTSFFKPSQKKFFQTKFYIEQRKNRGILMTDENSPMGGKWSFDAANRKKYPKKKTPPKISYPENNPFYEEAKMYVNQHFQDHLGELIDAPLYPTDYDSSQKWLKEFLKQRFEDFGAYEDAIVNGESILHHSVLTPMLNVGLLTPQEVLDAAFDCAKEYGIPINSNEGFVRQIIGWREFIRGMYECKGTEQRTKNFWGFDRKIPKSFYDGTTGIPPIDNTIQKVLKTGYCHHIERLMILGNFMVLCEFDPDDVYQWFMELFIDAYDWVMVPNVYGMSQFADGGLMSTKPYISGSNYLMKMSDYPKGDWQNIWDALFWRFMHVNRDFFQKNPRLGMLIGSFDKMPSKKQENLINTANDYLQNLIDS
ncbi:MAG: cryptochrome/photolyase family protein [Chitinophagales bacterium]